MAEAGNDTKRAESAPEPPRRSLTRRTVSGYFWLLGGSGMRSVLRILVLAVLARLLVPADFGLVGAAMIVLALADIFGQIGVSPALVHKQDLTEAHIRTGWTLTLLFGLGVGVLVYFLAYGIAALFRMPDLEPVLHGLAWIFPLRSLAIVAQGLLQRQMRFRAIATIELSSFTVGYAAMAIALAYAGFGVWALVFGQLAQTALTSLAYLAVARHSMRPQIDPTALRYLTRFGAGSTLAGFGNYAAMNADYFVVGRWLGAEALGFYTRAYYFLMQPANLVGALGERVLFPAIASIQSDAARMRKVYHRSIALVALFTAPLSAFLFVFAPEIIGLLLGDQWGMVVVPFRVLVVVLPFRTAYKITATLLRASGAIFAMAVWQWLYAATVLLGAWIGQSHGLDGVAVGVALAIAAGFWIGIAFARAINRISVRHVVVTFAKYAAVSIALAALLLVLRHVMEPFGLSPALMIALAGLVAAGFALPVWIFLPALFGDEGRWVRSMLARASDD